MADENIRDATADGSVGASPPKEAGQRHDHSYPSIVDAGFQTTELDPPIPIISEAKAEAVLFPFDLNEFPEGVGQAAAEALDMPIIGLEAAEYHDKAYPSNIKPGPSEPLSSSGVIVVDADEYRDQGYPSGLKLTISGPFSTSGGATPKTDACNPNKIVQTRRNIEPAMENEDPSDITWETSTSSITVDRTSASETCLQLLTSESIRPSILKPSESEDRSDITAELRLEPPNFFLSPGPMPDHDLSKKKGSRKRNRNAFSSLNRFRQAV